MAKLMIGFFLPEDVANRIAIGNGEHPDDLHITLLYLGEYAELPVDVINTVIRFASSHDQVSGEISGLAKFNAGENGVPFVALFDSPQLPAFRQDLVEAMGGLVGDQEHGFTPHITLSYIGENEQAPIVEIEKERMTFDAIAIAWGDHLYEFELGGNNKSFHPIRESVKFIRKVGSQYCIFSKSGKRLECKDSKGDARKRLRQIEFFKHREGKSMGEWITLDEMREICPNCAQEMEAKGFKRIRLDQIDDGGALKKRHHTEAWHRCWEKLKGKYSDRSAAAICTWSIKRPPNPPDVYKAMKSVITLTLDDAALIDDVLAASMEARGIAAIKIDTETWEVEDVIETPEVAPSGGSTRSVTEPDLAFLGGSVKALGDGKVGGYLVMFGDQDNTDIEREFFDASTDFGPHKTTVVLYNHGMDKVLKKRHLDDGAEIGIDDVGVWIRAQLKMRDDYERGLYKLAQDKKMGWSSGTASHLIEREQVGKSVHITKWMLGLDASLTPIPAEPRTLAMPIKSLAVKSLQSLLDESGSAVEPPKQEVASAGRKSTKAKAVSKSTKHKTIGGNTMSLKFNLTIEQLTEKIKELLPEVPEDTLGKLVAILQLAMAEPPVPETEPAPEPAPESSPPPEAMGEEVMKMLKKALADLGIEATGKQTKTKASPGKVPFSFKPEQPKDDDPQAAIKAVAQLRFGETDAAIKAVANDLYGVGYEVQRHIQHMAFAKFLRAGDRGLASDEERRSLKMIILTPKQLKAAIFSGVDVSAIKTDLAETVDRLGGVTVPEDMRLETIERLPGMTVVRARADVMQTSSDVMSRITVTGGDDRHVGAIRVTWVGDTPTANQAVTNPTFGVEKTPVHISMATVRVPRALIEDTAIPLTAKISEWVTGEYAIDEDEQFLIGNGIAKPQGILPGSTNALSLSHTASGHASTWPDANKVSNLMSIKYQVARQYRDRCVWIMNDTTAAELSSLQDGIGRPMWYNSLREGEPDRLLGYPALTSEAMPDIAANAFPLLFCDLSGYQIADRVGMTLTRDELTESETDIVKFVFRRRLGGQVTQTYRFAALEIAAS